MAIPAGLQGGPVFFEPLARSLGLNLFEYPASEFGKDKKDNLLKLESVLDRRPALLVIPTNIKVDHELLDRAEGRVGAFASVSTGTDHVDLNALEEAGIPFFHAPGVNSASVVEYIMAALPLFFSQERLLAGEVGFGIIGFGRIGSLLGRVLELLGFPFRYHDPFVQVDKHRAALREVVDADVVTFHVPLTFDGTDPTFEMVQGDYLSGIKEETVVINTSRGRIFTVESHLDLCRLRPTLMDVFPVEPPEERMLEASTLVTPHIAGYNYSARVGGAREVSLKYAVYRGLAAEIVPPVPEVDYDHYVVDFLERESRRLKERPESFRHRRVHYPYRGDFAAWRKNRSGKKLDPFRRKLLEQTASLTR